VEKKGKRDDMKRPNGGNESRTGGKMGRGAGKEIERERIARGLYKKPENRMSRKGVAD